MSSRKSSSKETITIFFNGNTRVKKYVWNLKIRDFSQEQMTWQVKKKKKKKVQKQTHESEQTCNKMTLKISG